MLVTRRLALTGAACLIASPALAADPGLAEVIARHTKACGGARAMDAIHSVSVDLDITEQGSTVRANYRATPEAMRIDIFAGGKRVYSEGLDARGSWDWDGGAPAAKDASPEGAKAIRHGMEFNLFGLHRFAERGHRLELAGREVVAGTDYHVIRVVMNDGFETFRYIDPKSWMVGRSRDVRAIHPDMDPTKKLLENVYEDFRPVDGVMTSFRSHQADVTTGAVLQTTQLLAQRCNPPAEALHLARDWAPA